MLSFAGARGMEWTGDSHLGRDAIAFFSFCEAMPPVFNRGKNIYGLHLQGKVGVRMDGNVVVRARVGARL